MFFSEHSVEQNYFRTLPLHLHPCKMKENENGYIAFCHQRCSVHCGAWAKRVGVCICLYDMELAAI